MPGTRWCVLVALILTANIAISAEPPAFVDRLDRTPRQVQDLEFETDRLKERFETFDAAARAYAGEGFKRQPYLQGGNFITSAWAKNCDFTKPFNVRGTRESFEGMHRISVDTIVVPFPKAKSAAVMVEVVSRDPEKWSFWFSYREATKQGVTGSGWRLNFYRWDPDRLGRIVPFRPNEETRDRLRLPIDAYSVGASSVGIRPDQPLEAEFLRHVRSADALRDACLADLDKLQRLAVALIEEKKAQKKVFEKYKGDGIPPEFRLVPLTEEERAAELAKANNHFATQSKLVRDHHREMYAAWRESFPMERCWPELKDR